jgi:hypothetical protein
MTDYTMTTEGTYDSQTGELQEPKLSEQAMRGVRRPNLWQKRDNTHIGLQVGDEFAYAFLCVQERLKAIIATDKENPFLKKEKDKKDSTAGDYTSLGFLLKTVRPILHEFFITLEQYTGDIIGLTDTASNKHLFLPVFTRFEHVPSMQQKIYKIQMPIVKFDCQSTGSAFSYGKRYALLGALGIASGVDDDDGNTASIVKGIDGKMGEVAEGLAETMKGFKSLQELRRWAKMNEAGFDLLEESDRQRLRVVYSDCIEALSGDHTPEDKPKGKAK